MKQAMKESAPFQHEGIMSISKSLAGNVDTKIKGMRRVAEKQGVDLDKLSEQEIKYMLELNKPKAPVVLSNEEAYKFLNEFLKQGKGKKGEVIKGKFGKSFSQEVDDIADKKLIEQMYRTSGPRSLDEDAGYLAEFIAEDAGKVLDDLPIKEQTKFIERAKNALRKNVKQYQPPETEIIEGIQTTKGLGDLFGRQLEKKVTVQTVIEDIKKLEPIESMKETNKVLKGEGKYKNLSKTDREKIAGDESVNDHIFERNIVDETEDFAQGGRAGIGYLLAEDTNERMPYEAGKKVGRPKGMSIPYRIGGGEYTIDPDFDELGADEWFKIVKAAMAGDYGALEYAKGGRSGYAGGGSGKPPIDFYVDFSGSGGGKQENFLNVPGLNKSGYNYGGTFGADTTFPFFGGELSVGGELGIGRDKSNVDYKGHPIDWLSNVGETKLGDDWNVGMKWRKKFAGGGMGRRGFLKLMAALGLSGAAAKSGLVTLFQKSTPKIAKDLTSIPIKNAEGMPSWFKPLVNRVIKEGVETTKLAPNKGGAYLDRQIVHSAKLGEGQGVRVYQNLDDQTINVEYQSVDNLGGVDDGIVNLEYKAPEVLEGPIKKGQPTKTKPTFEAEEAYPHGTTGDYKDITFEGSNVVTKVDDLYSDTSALKQFGTNKALNKKELEIAKQKRKRVNEINNDLGEQNSLLPEPPDPDFASGGIAKLLGE